ncbi:MULTISPECIES: endonuclease/exonuclease/phosphatase family protein [Nostocales]|uniref:Endonuclease/exonuclease/phosphatase n=3 Tax=Nostocales TaxID=1161 RepID=A0A0C1QMJ8_9CYAN|nr:endonuclease/exonuclease/phosphatase family protein [Tolypothrix bouteillei]KAF3889886.1 endonuclease/exonuclease/phosphatase family protein [Tolypothrix bouteillei VB521301]
MVKLATINILFDLEEWEQRRSLLVDGLAAEQADLIALQEVKLPENTALELAERLGMPYVQLVQEPTLGLQQKTHTIAILSRHPFVLQEVLDLQSQGRFAQYVQVVIDGQPLVFCNGHYYWYPGSHPERDRQVQLLLDWLSHLPQEMPIVAVGDFNGTPETSAIALMRSRFSSAYAAHHSHEPEYTCPTPLARRTWKKALRLLIRDWRSNRTLRPWRGTLDYIFVNQHIRVQDAYIILDKPAPSSRTLYPSDHFGIAAVVEIVGS